MPLPASTPPPHPDDRRAAIAEKARVRRERTRAIRRRIAAGAVSAFLAFFALISFQMVTGHDPVLSASSRTTTQASSQAVATGTGESDDDASISNADTGSSASSSASTPSTQSSQSSSGPSAVTTQQS